jgi:hypothetical protein
MTFKTGTVSYRDPKNICISCGPHCVCLTPEDQANLRDDILKPLNGRRRKKSYEQILSELTEYCGWQKD